MQIFSGSSNPDLVRKIAKEAGLTLGKVEISAFANGETRIWVKDKVESKVAVLQSLSSPTNEHLVEFVLLIDALERKGAKEITAIIPWMGYSKQDKVFRPGEPLSAKVVAEILQTVKLKKIITIDLHNQATRGFFKVPVVELSARRLFAKFYANFSGLVVAPDEGAVKSSTELAEMLGVGVVCVDKKRDLVSGQVKVAGVSRSVEGQDLLIIDDNVFTGSTLTTTVRELKKRGAGKIKVGVTHHLYVPGVQAKLEKSPIDELVVTDTIKNPQSEILNKKFERGGKLKILSVAGLIAAELT